MTIPKPGQHGLVTTGMILHWDGQWCVILMLVLNSITISIHKPQRLKMGVGTEMESNSGVPVYQPSALLLGQTGSLSTCFFP